MRRTWTPVLIVGLVGAILGIFQNCTPAVPFGNYYYYSQLISSKTFPYEAGFDQIAYMSCSEQQDIANDGTFFTFKVGAYNDLGLRINQTYRDETFGLGDQNVIFALQESLISAGTRLQLGVRTLDNLQLMYIDQENGAEGLEGSDYSNFFPAMGTPLLSEMLWFMEPGDHLRFYAGAQFAEDYRFEGRLQFMKSQPMENGLRSFLNGRGILAVTFADLGKIEPLGPGSFVDVQPVGDGSAPPPAVGTEKVQASNLRMVNQNDLTANVFGMGAQVRFKQPTTLWGGPPGPDMPPRLLSSVQDVVIDGRLSAETQRAWVCPDSMQFMIVLPEHANFQDEAGNTVVRCAMQPDPVNPSLELRRLRQSLLSEDWFIDPIRKCAVPKPDHVQPGSCYGKNSNTQRTHIINYETWHTNGCGFGNVNGLCPHYVSVCIRP